jgi:hypothetical protein
MYMTRLEYKYLIKSEFLNRFRDMILPFLEYDDNAGEADIPEYTVRSIYFDTPSLKYYTEKIEGIDIRKKLRIRGYNNGGDTNEVYLEIKRKNIQSVWKNRAPLHFSHIRSLIETGNTRRYIITNNGVADAENNARRFLYHFYKKTLQPIVLVTYEREAYFGKFDKSFRLTIDKNLRSSMFPSVDDLYRDNDMVDCLPGQFIVEIKFGNSLPGWIKGILGTFGTFRKAVSKYCISVDAHRTQVKQFSKPVILANSESL